MAEEFRVHNLAEAFGWQPDEEEPTRTVVFEKVHAEGDFVLGNKIVNQVAPPPTNYYAEQAGAFPSEPAAAEEPDDSRQLPPRRIVRGELAE